MSSCLCLKGYATSVCTAIMCIHLPGRAFDPPGMLYTFFLTASLSTSAPLLPASLCLIALFKLPPKVPVRARSPTIRCLFFNCAPLLSLCGGMYVNGYASVWNNGVLPEHRIQCTVHGTQGQFATLIELLQYPLSSYRPSSVLRCIWDNLISCTSGYCRNHLPRVRSHIACMSVSLTSDTSSLNVIRSFIRRSSHPWQPLSWLDAAWIEHDAVILELHRWEHVYHEAVSNSIGITCTAST